MTRAELVAELLKLDPEERRRIAEYLQSSVDDGFALTNEEAAEFRQLMDEIARNPSMHVPWAEIGARLSAEFE